MSEQSLFLNGKAKSEFSDKLDYEMEKVMLMDELPTNWTYPLIQPKLIEEYEQREKYMH